MEDARWNVPALTRRHMFTRNFSAPIHLCLLMLPYGTRRFSGRIFDFKLKAENGARVCVRARVCVT
jgi:hypothetical protein